MSTVNRRDTDHSPFRNVILIQISVQTDNFHSCVYFQREVAMLLQSVKMYLLLCSVRDVTKERQSCPRRMEYTEGPLVHHHHCGNPKSRRNPIFAGRQLESQLTVWTQLNAEQGIGSAQLSALRPSPFAPVK